LKMEDIQDVMQDGHEFGLPRCPECNAVLKEKVGYDKDGNDYEGLVCPNGCDLKEI